MNLFSKYAAASLIFCLISASAAQADMVGPQPTNRAKDCDVSFIPAQNGMASSCIVTISWCNGSTTTKTASGLTIGECATQGMSPTVCPVRAEDWQKPKDKRCGLILEPVKPILAPRAVQ